MLTLLAVIVGVLVAWWVFVLCWCKAAGRADNAAESFWESEVIDANRGQ